MFHQLIQTYGCLCVFIYGSVSRYYAVINCSKEKKTAEEMQAEEERVRAAEAERVIQEQETVQKLVALKLEDEKLVSSRAGPLQHFLSQHVMPTLTAALLEVYRTY